MWLTTLLRALENWALPAVCALCSQPGAAPGFDLCAACEADLPPASPTAPPPGLDALWPAFAYAFPVDAMIRELKFAGQVHHARILGLACLRRLRTVRWPFAPVDGLLPVPLHRARLGKRGFNQSREIALPIARGLRLPLMTELAWRPRATAPQTLVAAHARPLNLHEAFAVRRPVQNLSLLLIDDVTTTGATLAELARVLRAAGARQVAALTVASAAGHDCAWHEARNADRQPWKR